MTWLEWNELPGLGAYGERLSAGRFDGAEILTSCGADSVSAPAAVRALTVQPPGQRPAVAVNLVPGNVEALFVRQAVGGGRGHGKGLSGEG